MRIPAFKGRHARLRFKPREWEAMVGELRRRGRGIVESGAFLLSPNTETSGRIAHIAYYDDLDPECLQGGISLRGFAYSKLWDICAERGLKLVADVHTHPGSKVAQSSTDRAHPMHSRPGHVALILPRLAAESVEPRQVGVHEYRGDDGWQSHYGRKAARMLYVGRWA